MNVRDINALDKESFEYTMNRLFQLGTAPGTNHTRRSMIDMVLRLAKWANIHGTKDMSEYSREFGMGSCVAMFAIGTAWTDMLEAEMLEAEREGQFGKANDPVFKLCHLYMNFCRSESGLNRIPLVGYDGILEVFQDVYPSIKEVSPILTKIMFEGLMGVLVSCGEYSMHTHIYDYVSSFWA